MVPYFPKQISYRAIVIYLAALITVSLVYSSFAMRFEFFVFGLVSVLGFFLLSSYLTMNWKEIQSKVFLQRLFLIALILRLLWVVFSFYYYSRVTGQPFEFGSADAVAYHDGGVWVSTFEWKEIIPHYFSDWAYISDSGYPFYLTVLYKVFGPSILLTRILKAFIGAFTCVLIYHLSARTFDEYTARMATIMCALMPNLIFYCGYHLKEVEMLFLEVAFLERMDYLLRSKKITFWNILLPTILAISLFFFRTVLGAVAVFSFATSVFLSTAPTMKKGWRRMAIIGWGLLCVIVLGSGSIMLEVEGIWERRSENLVNKRTEQTIRGNQWAQYATGTVMAPMMLALPFATMVDVDEQYGQQEKNGGNYIRNFMAFFAFLAIYEAIRRKQWRDFSLIGSFAFAYLGVISLTGFSNSERFLLPALPCLLMMWSYGVSTLRKQTYKLMMPWSIVVFVMEFAWAFFKLGSRGIL